MLEFYQIWHRARGCSFHILLYEIVLLCLLNLDFVVVEVRCKVLLAFCSPSFYGFDKREWKRRKYGRDSPKGMEEVRDFLERHFGRDFA